MAIVSKVSFGNFARENCSSGGVRKERHRERELLEKIASMTNEEILTASARNAQKNAEQSNAARALKNGPFMFIAATSLTAGALSKGKLSNKMSAAAKSLAIGASICALQAPVSKGVDKSIDFISKKDNSEFSEKHPAARFAIDFAALAGASAMLFAMAKNGKSFMKDKFPDAIKSVKNTISKGTAKLNSSKAGNFTNSISKKVSGFSSRHPKVADLARSALFFFPLVFFVDAAFALKDKANKNYEEDFYNNAAKLFTCRESAKSMLKNSDSQTEQV